ncbi:MAG: DUF3786 domain-containing protein [Oscillospiraceae bacterium]|jgi:hypothetical protein|nr:DUF3786 domain-containing protein [Oscillospiraceae bacterium]
MQKNNQEASLEHYLPIYRELDPSEAEARTGLEYSKSQGRFTLQVMGHTLYAAWPEFDLIPDNYETCPKTLYSFPMQVLTVRVLTVGVNALSSGEFKAYRELPWGELYDPNFNGRCIKRFAYGFGFKPDAFKKAAELLGGTKQELGDVAYDLKFLGNIICRVILWTPDEEFPPSAQFLFSDNTSLMYNAEDLAVVGDVIISTLKEMS